MHAFSALLDRLILTPSRNAKLTLLVDYFHTAPDPDRGYALAAITRDLDISNVKPALLRRLIEERMDPVLFGHSYDYVGDMAETIALAWPSVNSDSNMSGAGVRLAAVVAALQDVPKAGAPTLVAGFLDQLDPTTRWAFLKLLTGGLRIGVSARLVKQALADFGAVDVTEIEELWHGLTPPYTSLFAWLEGREAKPVNLAAAPFRPVMLAHPLEAADHARITPEDYAAEWKWDGIRVQATAEAGTVRLYSRTGDDISAAFPDILEALNFNGAIDGELLVKALDAEPEGERDTRSAIPVASFGDLQQRLNRKAVSKKLLATHPAFIRAYDLLQEGNENLRALPFAERRKRLEALILRLANDRIDLSPLISYRHVDDLDQYRAKPPYPVIEGVMLKRWDSIYEPGRPKGPWFKWKKQPYIIDAVLMYAQRGHGKRSSFYSDYTFGVWLGGSDAADRDHSDGAVLVPVGKAYFGFSDDELKQIDKYVRDNTVDRFGPVRAVRAEAGHGLVFEVAFEGLNRSTRHKSGVAMRFPRISRLRWDKHPRDADRIETLEAMLG